MAAEAAVQVALPVVRGVSKATPAARRSQRIAAGIVFVVPSIGLAAGLWQLSNGAVRPGAIVLFGLLYVLTQLGVTIGYHRHFAHKAFETSRAMQFLLVVFGAMAAQGPLFFWVATHRRHHAYSDRPGDPHSPNLVSGPFATLRGFAHAHMGWMLSDEVTSWPVFARDLMRSPYVYWLHRIYWPALSAGLLLPAAIGAVSWGGFSGALDGLIWGGLIRIWLLNQASWCVGSISHMFGSRPFKTRDKSANNWLVALFTGGEGLQNNHHAFPSSAVHALHWWEPDFAGQTIRFLARLGLVWDVNRPSARAISAGRAGRVLCHLGRIEDVPPAVEASEDAVTVGPKRALASERSSAFKNENWAVRLWVGLVAVSTAARGRFRRGGLGLLSRVAPALAARVAFSRFLKPPRFLADDIAHVPRAGVGTPVSVPHRGTRLLGKKWGSGPAVLLMHGWGTELSHLAGLVDPLTEAGFSVIGFDAPAHGASNQRQADIVEFADAIQSAWGTLGPFHAMVGHSFGAASLLLSIARHGLRPEKLVLVAVPASVVWMTQDFADRSGISRAVARRMRSLMAARSGLSWRESGIESIIAAIVAPTLFVHDESDKVVPYSHCQRLAARAKNGRVFTTRGRGHSGPLWDRTVIRNIVEFVHPLGAPAAVTSTNDARAMELS